MLCVAGWAIGMVASLGSVLYLVDKRRPSDRSQAAQPDTREFNRSLTFVLFVLGSGVFTTDPVCMRERIQPSYVVFNRKANWE